MSDLDSGSIYCLLTSPFHQASLSQASALFPTGPCCAVYVSLLAGVFLILVLISCLRMQVGAKIVKAGPTNSTVYMTGISFIYKEHQILVEVNNDGSGIVGEHRAHHHWLF